ncbi:MAG: Fe-S protein assembly co-chaperone HscB [Phycisphaerae bacterium]|nr:Fe-S protein assembly co-chaperone HscB [Phycisphaerae bacterium]
MTDRDRQTIPAKCQRCEKPLSDVTVCDYCHSLNPAAAGVDYFTLLGLPRQFELDEDLLTGRFHTLSRAVHPDTHGAESADAQLLALQISAAVNDAYRTLKSPALRAAYLLELLGGKSSAEDKSVPEGFLATMMMMQEEVHDAKTAGNAAELARLRDVLTVQHEGLLRRIGGLFRELAEGASCEAVRNDLLGEIRRQLNAVSYVRKLLEQAG